MMVGEFVKRWIAEASSADGRQARAAAVAAALGVVGVLGELRGYPAGRLLPAVLRLPVETLKPKH